MRKIQSTLILAFLALILALPVYPQPDASPAVREGFQLLQSENFAAAVAHFNGILKTDPNNYQARLGLAIGLIGVDKFSDASREIAKLLARTPKDAKLLEMAAQAFWQQKRFAEAEKVLKRRLDLGDAPAALWAMYGDALEAQKRTPDAILAYESAVKLAPDSNDYRYALGAAYWKQFRYTEIAVS